MGGTGVMLAVASWYARVRARASAISARSASAAASSRLSSVAICSGSVPTNASQAVPEFEPPLATTS